MTGRWLAVLGWLAQRLGLHEIKPSRTDLYRVLVLVSVCVVTSLMVVDYARAPTDSLVQGDPAPRTVKAPFTFQYADHLALERAREEAEAGVRPVYVHRADLVTELRERVGEAFSQARTTLGQRLEAAGGAVEPGTLDENARSGVVEVFRSELGVTVTAIHLNGVPFYVILMALAVGGAIHGAQVWGACLVAAGALLAQLPARKRRPATLTLED